MPSTFVCYRLPCLLTGQHVLQRPVKAERCLVQLLTRLWPASGVARAAGELKEGPQRPSVVVCREALLGDPKGMHIVQVLRTKQPPCYGPFSLPN